MVTNFYFDEVIFMKYKAITFARDKHKGHLDDGGKDYFSNHCYKVMMAVETFTDDYEVIQAAVLHDTIEDTDTTYEELVELFGQRVADLVNEVTHEGKKDGYGYYFPRLDTKDGILIKLCDRASNVSRMGPWNRDRRQQYLKKTIFWKDGSDRPSKCIYCKKPESVHIKGKIGDGVGPKWCDKSENSTQFVQEGYIKVDSELNTKEDKK